MAILAGLFRSTGKRTSLQFGNLGAFISSSTSKLNATKLAWNKSGSFVALIEHNSLVIATASMHEIIRVNETPLSFVWNQENVFVYNTTKCVNACEESLEFFC
jgi:hypothetical protein